MQHITDFFVGIFELKTSVWIIIGVFVAAHVELMPQIIATLKQKGGLRSSNGAVGEVKTDTEDLLRFISLIGLTAFSLFALSIILHTEFIYLDSRSELIKWFSYLNILLLVGVTFYSSPWGSKLIQGITVQKLLLIVNTFIVWNVLCMVITHIFRRYIFSDQFWQSDGALYFTNLEWCLLALFYAFNLLLIFRKEYNGIFFTVARNISVAILSIFIGCNFYMLSTHPMREDAMIKTFLKDDSKAIKELRELERLK